MQASFSISQEIDIIKLNIDGTEKWRYKGRILSLNGHEIYIEAFFDQQDLEIHGLFIGKNDRFLETYYSDRWYNIYEIYARDQGGLRGWYCNISTPVRYGEKSISYIDLALDLIILPDGSQIIVDQDEFLELNIPPLMRAESLKALDELRNKFNIKFSKNLEV